MMTATPGQLRHRITIQSPVEHGDKQGGSDSSFVDVTKTFARITPGAGREFYAQQALRPTLSHQITIRYRAGITPTMRVLFGTRVFDVRAVRDPEERHVWLELTCEEYTP